MKFSLQQKNPMKLPGRGRSEKNEEWGRELGGIVVCPECRNLHYKKIWHHPGVFPDNLGDAPISEKICPACKMTRDHMFEGELFVENIPEERRQEFFNLIASFGRRAFKRDPQDRLIEITDRGARGCRVTFTDNQMAVRSAKKIKDVFKKVVMKISYTKEPAEVSRVYVVFRSPGTS